MPLKPIIDIAVNDERFKQFLDLFAKYQEAVANLPDDWGKVGAATEKTGLTLESMSALMLTQAEMLHRLTHEHQELERSASGYGRIMQGAAREVGNIARSVADTTRNLLRWTGITGLLGVGGLFGLDHLFGNASSLRTRSMGLGASPGTVLAANTNFGQFINAQGALSGIANLQQNLSGQIAFNTLGIPGSWNADPGAALTSVLGAVHDLYRQTPAGERQNMPWYQQASQFLSPEDIRTIGNMNDAEFRRHLADYQRDRAGNFGLQPGTLQAAQDVDRQLTRVGYVLEYTFLAALKPIMPELESLSQSLGQTVSAFLQGPGFAHLVDLVSTGLHDLSQWLASDDFKTDVKEFVADIGALAHGVEKALKYFNLIPDPNASSTSDISSGGAMAGAGAGAWLGKMFGPWGAVIGGIGGAILGSGVFKEPKAGASLPNVDWGGNIWGPGSQSTNGQSDSIFSRAWHYLFPSARAAPMPGFGAGATPANRAAFDAATTIADPTAAAAASIIAWRESRDQDINNSKYSIWGYGPDGVAKGYTASGYYQILDTNWHKYGAGLVDFSKYPHAQGAPRALQDAVFAKMYGTEGYAPWDAAHGGSITSDQQFHAEMAKRLADSSTARLPTLPSKFLGPQSQDQAAGPPDSAKLPTLPSQYIFGADKPPAGAGQPGFDWSGHENARDLARVRAEIEANKPRDSDFNRDAWFGAAKRMFDKRAGAQPRQNVKITIDNQTGGSAVVSASQMQVAY